HRRGSANSGDGGCSRIDPGGMTPMKSHTGKDAQAPLRCAITGEELPRSKLVSLEHLRPSLVEHIRAKFPQLADSDLISRREADRLRVLYVEDMLRQERGEVTELDQQVTRSLAQGELISQN